eukprot:1160714-Pelagomonas_calceolata.AAC.2
MRGVIHHMNVSSVGLFGPQGDIAWQGRPHAGPTRMAQGQRLLVVCMRSCRPPELLGQFSLLDLSLCDWPS